MLLSTINMSWCLAVILIIYFMYYIWCRFFSLHGLPANLPWAGAGNSPLSRARIIRKSLFGLREIIQDGYYKYSKNEQVFVLPNLATGPEVILPMSQMKWLLEQPDHVLNQNEVNSEFLHAERTMLHPHVIRDTVHGHIIRRELTKDLDNYAEAAVEEIQHALNNVWGSNTQDWKDVPLYDTLLEVIGRISNRVLVGLPLCRDKDYLRSTTTFARSVVITAGMINLLPPMLRPILGPLITAYDKSHYRNIAKHIFPIVGERMANFKPGLDYRNPDYSKHNDYIQWALHDAFSHNDPAERTPEMITKRLTVLSFAAIQSSVITITNVLFDIAASSRCEQIQDSLREEINSVIAEKPGQEWRRASLNAMNRVDSALRESMRLWGFISRGVMKKVVAPGGVDIPSGDHLPYGSKVGVTSYGIHHDESAYPNALHYDPFRFAAPSEKRPDGEKSANKPFNLVTTTDNWMAFSHGRHACPGRWFAANQLKLLLSQIVLNYDIESIPERPQNPWINNTVGPPIWSTLRIRRRPNTASIECPEAPPTLSPSFFEKDPKDLSSFPFPQRDSRRPSTFLDAKLLQHLASTAHEIASPITVS